jgi:hypothetical protein
MTVLWRVTPYCSLVEIDRYFRDAYCHHHRGETSVSIYETTQGILSRANPKYQFSQWVNMINNDLIGYLFRRINWLIDLLYGV